MLKILATCAVIVVGVGWMLHVPPYEGYSTFSKVANFLTIAKVMHHHIPNVVEFFGLGTKHETIRSLMDFLIEYAPKDFPEVQAKDFVFNGVAVRVYWPADFDQSAIRTSTGNHDQSDSTQRRLAALVYYHGGGCVLGSVKQADNFSRRLVNDLNVVVISVEYRLAPEHIYPAAHDDALNAALYVLEHSDELGVDGTRVGVIGDSSGGYLAAATAQSLHKMAQEEGGARWPSLKLQVLLYPTLQMVNTNTPSRMKNANDPILPRDRVWFLAYYAFGHQRYSKALAANNHTSPDFKKYLASGPMNYEKLVPERYKDPNFRIQPHDLDFGDVDLWNEIKVILADPRFAPLLAEDKDLKGLPTAIVFTCQYDILSDDGIMYATRLEQAGVPVKLIHAEKGFHSILSFAGTFPEATDMFNDVTAHIKRLL